MSKNADNRGAENQRILFSYVKKIYPNLEVLYEFLLPNGMRYDIFVPALGICIEYDGALWHESEEAVSRDRRKSVELLSLGYNVARVRTELGKYKLPSLEIDDPNYSEIFCKENSIRIAEQVVKTLVLQPNYI